MTYPTSANGMPIDAKDKHGMPIHVGDTLRFDRDEWGGDNNVFTVTVRRGGIEYLGAPSDLREYCEILTKFDGTVIRR